MPAKRFHLAWFLQGSSVQAWGEPWTGNISEDWMSADMFLDLARAIERACFDYMLLEDSIYIGQNWQNSRDIFLKNGMSIPRQEPTVVATLMAPVLVEVAQQNDLAVPLVAVHLFVFYFGLMADVHPPAGLAAYAAAAISGADPIKTGLQGFWYEIRTGLLPFIFIFNTELLLIDIGDAAHFALIVGCSIVAMGCFVSATQNWLVTRNRWYETLALLLICFTLFRPGYWLDRLQAPFDAQPASDIVSVADTIPRGSTLRFRVLSQSRAGEDVEKLVRLTMRSGNTGTERLQRAGLSFSALGDKVTVSLISFGSEAAKYGLAPGDEVSAVLVPAHRPSRYWFAIPALLLLAGIILLQRRRHQFKLAVAR